MVRKASQKRTIKPSQQAQTPPGVAIMGGAIVGTISRGIIQGRADFSLSNDVSNTPLLTLFW